MFQGSIRLHETNTLFWDYFRGQRRVFWALGLHNSIKSYADGTMICLLIVNVHKDMFYSNAGAFSGHYCWKSRCWVDSRGQKGGFWAVDASKVHKTVHTSKEYVPIDNKILMIYSYHNIWSISDQLFRKIPILGHFRGVKMGYSCPGHLPNR